FAPQREVVRLFAWVKPQEATPVDMEYLWAQTIVLPGGGMFVPAKDMATVDAVRMARPLTRYPANIQVVGASLVRGKDQIELWHGGTADGRQLINLVAESRDFLSEAVSERWGEHPDVQVLAISDVDRTDWF